MSCAWLDECGVCALKTIIDQDEFIYCEFIRSDMSDCSNFTKYGSD